MKTRVPRYHQIAQSLRERIAEGHPGAGERLDNQRGLAREYGVTLMTLRHALELLERDGLITRRHGLDVRGLADRRLRHPAPPTFAGDLRARGARGPRFLRSRFVQADRWVARELGVGRARSRLRPERLQDWSTASDQLPGGPTCPPPSARGGEGRSSR
jgi:GntR family transcriptional regulator